MLPMFLKTLIWWSCFRLLSLLTGLGVPRFSLQVCSSASISLEEVLIMQVHGQVDTNVCCSCLHNILLAHRDFSAGREDLPVCRQSSHIQQPYQATFAHLCLQHLMTSVVSSFGPPRQLGHKSRIKFPVSFNIRQPGKNSVGITPGIIRTLYFAVSQHFGLLLPLSFSEHQILVKLWLLWHKIDYYAKLLWSFLILLWNGMGWLPGEGQYHTAIICSADSPSLISSISEGDNKIQPAGVFILQFLT